MSLSRVRPLAWTAAYQAPPSMGFSRQQYWSGVPLPSPRAWKDTCKVVGCPLIATSPTFDLFFSSQCLSLLFGDSFCEIAAFSVFCYCPIPCPDCGSLFPWWWSGWELGWGVVRRVYITKQFSIISLKWYFNDFRFYYKFSRKWEK